MNRIGSRIDAVHAVERKGAEMSTAILARNFIAHPRPISVALSAPESS